MNIIQNIIREAQWCSLHAVLVFSTEKAISQGLCDVKSQVQGGVHPPKVF